MKDTNPSFGKRHASQHSLTEVSGTSKKAVFYFNAHLLNCNYRFYTLSSRHKACCFDKTFGAGSSAFYAWHLTLHFKFLSFSSFKTCNIRLCLSNILRVCEHLVIVNQILNCDYSVSIFFTSLSVLPFIESSVSYICIDKEFSIQFQTPQDDLLSNRSILTFVDLPGAERLIFDSTSIRLRERPSLNSGILSFAQVVADLAKSPEPDRVVNYE